MSDINKVTLVGRLTRDAEQSYTQSGYAVLKFSIAVNRRKKQGDQWVDEANFFDVTSWGKQGEAIAPYMTKGQQVAIDGELRQDRWEAQDGLRRSKVYVSANYVQLLGGKPDSNKRSDSSGFWPDDKSDPASPQFDGPRSHQEARRMTSTGLNFEDDIPF
jgi:single-strand DNA-binding protein